MKKFLSVLFGVLLLSGLAFSAQAEDAVISNGKKVSIDYTLTVEGQVVDTSQGKAPLEYVQGEGKIIPGLEKQLDGLKVGEEKDIAVKADEAYGPIDPNGVQEIQKSLIPTDIKLDPGIILEMSDSNGTVYPATVKEVKEQSVMLDFNHPLAGKDLSFHIKVVDVK